MPFIHLSLPVLTMILGISHLDKLTKEPDTHMLLCLILVTACSIWFARTAWIALVPKQF